MEATECIDVGIDHDIQVLPELKPSTDEEVSCPSRDPTRELEVGIHPKRCSSSEDCKLVSGEHSKCECGMDGKKWCTADLHSFVFDNYWIACQEGTITPAQQDWWQSRQQQYVLMETSPVCIDNISEIAQLAALEHMAFEAANLIIMVICVIVI